MNLKIKRLYKDSMMPIQGTTHSACIDFYVNRVEYKGEGRAILHLGVACEFDDDYVLTLQPRSSLTHTGWVMANSPAQIDSDYRGELQIRLDAIPNIEGNTNYQPLPYDVGERCVQGRLEKVEKVKIKEVDTLTETKRAAGGFGSTGKK